MTNPLRFPPAPPGSRLYAIGDIHGRLDLLDRLLAEIEADAARARAARNLVVCLGDYVDRGPDSAGVIDRLVDFHRPNLALVCLRGNHEDMMLGFLREPDQHAHWLTNGGLATLASYGVVADGPLDDPATLWRRREALARALPPQHKMFLQSLAISHLEGDYCFVHAGLRPGVPFERQADADMMWIRTPFLRCTAAFERIVIHGHSIEPLPDVRSNRIGIDTGAFYTGRLTAAVVGAEGVDFLTASD